jgi:hypothetical protein
MEKKKNVASIRKLFKKSNIFAGLYLPYFLYITFKRNLLKPGLKASALTRLIIVQAVCMNRFLHRKTAVA